MSVIFKLKKKQISKHLKISRAATHEKKLIYREKMLKTKFYCLKKINN